MRTKPNLMSFMGVIFVVGCILFFIGFYTLPSSSLYPMMIFLISILLIRVFQEKISYFELSKNAVFVKMKEDQEKDYDKTTSLKKQWNYSERIEKTK